MNIKTLKINRNPKTHTIIAIIAICATSIANIVIKNEYSYINLPPIIKSSFSSLVLMNLNCIPTYYLLKNSKYNKTVLMLLTLNNIIHIISHNNESTFNFIRLMFEETHFRGLYSPILTIFQSIFQLNYQLFLSSLFSSITSICLIIIAITFRNNNFK